MLLCGNIECVSEVEQYAEGVRYFQPSYAEGVRYFQPSYAEGVREFKPSGWSAATTLGLAR
jgi:hypothetical protein